MKLFSLLFISTLLMACGGSGSDSSDSNNPVPADTTAPTASIVFPLEHSISDQHSITVRGTANDNQSNIESVRINGVDATTSDNYANWQVLIPLDIGINTLNVETTDSESNTDSNAAQIIVDQGSYLWNPKDMALDKANNRLLLIDYDIYGSASSAIVAIDLSTYHRSIFSNSDIPNSDNPFQNPSAITMDFSNGRALVTDTSLKGVIAVDLITGERSILSNNTTPNTDSPLFDDPSGIAIDHDNNRALVTEGISLSPSIIAVDLSTGSRSVLSDATTPNADELFNRLDDIAVDRNNGRALVIDSYGDTIKAVDLTTGEREVISSDLIPNSNNRLVIAERINIDRINDRAVVVDRFYNTVVAIDLSDGERTILVENTQANEFLRKPSSLVTDPTIQTSYILNDSNHSVVSANLSSGQLDSIITPNIPDTHNILSRPGSIIHANVDDQLFVIDSGLKAILSVDKKTGVRSVLSDTTTPNSNNPLEDTLQIILDQPNKRLLTLDEYRVMSVDIANGERTILSDNVTPSTDTPFIDAIAIALDSSQNRALVLDDDYLNEKIIEVDLTSGKRSIVTDISALVSSIGSIDLKGMVFDSINNKIFIAANDYGLTNGYILSVDLVNGDQKILSDNQTPNANNVLNTISGIEIDHVNNRLLVVESAEAKIMAVDLKSGERMVLSDNVGNYIYAGGIAYENEKNLAYVTTVDMGLMLVDLSSGERVVFSK